VVAQPNVVRVPHKQVPAYTSLFDVAPFPRLPLPVCEMISPIKPFESIATDLARALGELLDTPELRFKLGESARTWVTNERDWSSIVDIVDSTSREILA
jgi:hypothetical protein